MGKQDAIDSIKAKIGFVHVHVLLQYCEARKRFKGKKADLYAAAILQMNPKDSNELIADVKKKIAAAKAEKENARLLSQLYDTYVPETARRFLEFLAPSGKTEATLVGGLGDASYASDLGDASYA